MPAVLGVTPVQVIDEACRLWGVPVSKMLSRDKSHPFVEYRFAAMYVTRKLCALSYPGTARVFHRLDHTTVMNAVKRVEGSERLTAMAERLEREVLGAGVGATFT